jgi:hypothetical protein
VVKSRGSSHSNLVRVLQLTDEGARIADAPSDLILTTRVDVT